jgi:hypothetical protein
MRKAEWRIPNKWKSTMEPMVAVLEEPESGLLDAWWAMREFPLSKQGVRKKARLGEEETLRLWDGALRA